MLEILKAFESHPFVAQLSERDRMMLAAGAQPFHFHQDDYLAVEGEPAEDFFLIQSGDAVIESWKGADEGVRVQRLGAGDVLGWSWLIEPHVWQFSCRALNEVRGIKFDGSWLRQLCESDHELGFHLLKQLLRAIASRLAAMRTTFSALADSKGQKKMNSFWASNFDSQREPQKA